MSRNSWTFGALIGIFFVLGSCLPIPLQAANRTLLPSKFQGEWQVAATQCGGTEEYSLWISGRALKFYEATFIPTKVTRIGISGLRLSGNWFEGGESTRTSVRLKLAPGGRTLTVINHGRVRERIRCLKKR